MARYVARVRTDRSVPEAFDYLSDVRSLAEWDPGVRRVTQVEGDGPGPGAAYDVVVAGVGVDLTLRYRVVAFDAPASLRIVATSAAFVSDDLITVSSDGGSTLVTYDADLRLRGPLRLGDLALRLVFGRIGDRAAAGLVRALDGRPVPS